MSMISPFKRNTGNSTTKPPARGEPVRWSEIYNIGKQEGTQEREDTGRNEHPPASLPDDYSASRAHDRASQEDIEHQYPLRSRMQRAAYQP